MCLQLGCVSHVCVGAVTVCALRLAVYQTMLPTYHSVTDPPAGAQQPCHHWVAAAPGHPQCACHKTGEAGPGPPAAATVSRAAEATPQGAV
jgi:hypothetical protein